MTILRQEEIKAKNERHNIKAFLNSQLLSIFLGAATAGVW